MRLRNRAAGTAIATLVGMFAAADAHAVTFIDHFGSSITNAPNAATIEAAITATTNSIGSLYSNPVTVQILFQQGPGSFLAQTQSTIFFSNTAAYNGFSTTESLAHPENLPLAEGLAHLSTGNGFPNSNLIVTGANLRALGQTAPGGFDLNGNPVAGGGIDSVITLSTTQPLDYNLVVPPFNGSNLAFNGRNTIAHEVDEVLSGGGQGSNLNNIFFLENGGTLDPFFRTAVGTLDRFRYAAPGVASFTTAATATAFFSLDGGATNLVGFNQDHTGNYGDWGPNITPCSGGGFGGPGGTIGMIQNAFNCNNLATISFRRGLTEDTMLQSIGWNPAAAIPEPATWAMMLLGLGGLGVAMRTTRRKSGAALAAA